MPDDSAPTGLDRYTLYEEAVQCPAFEVDFCETAFAEVYGRVPLSLREDFCGSAAIALEWVRSHPQRRALAIDLDPEPLARRRAALAGVERSERERLELRCGDVREARAAPVDVLLAVNFSYFVFRERSELLRYFQAARRGVADEGLFVLDMMGGPACEQEEHTTTRQVGDFVYTWEHATFEPISRRTTCRIHFELADGRSLRDAFVYDWRLWTMPEVREALAEAGFARTEVYWEELDPETEEGTGRYTRRERAEAYDGWTAYLVAFPGRATAEPGAARVVGPLRSRSNR